jgi:hypothetical protein
MLATASNGRETPPGLLRDGTITKGPRGTYGGAGGPFGSITAGPLPSCMGFHLTAMTDLNPSQVVIGADWELFKPRG